jgi:hypothetical protein
VPRTRNINNNIEFGLSFPTPINARRSKTPTTGRRASRRTTETPARRPVSQEPIATIPGLPEASTVGRPSKRKSSFLDAVTDGPAPPTEKRRRKIDATEVPLGVNRQESNRRGSNRQSIPRRQASRKSDFIAIAEEASRDEASTPLNQVQADIPQGVEESLLDLQEDKENDEPSLGATQSKRKKRKSIARKFTRPKKRSSTGSLQEEQAEGLPIVPNTELSTGEDSSAGTSTNQSSGDKPTSFPIVVRQHQGVAIPTKAPRAKEQAQQSTVDEGPPTSTGARTKAPRAIFAAPEVAESEAEGSVRSQQNEGPSKKRRKRKSIVIKKKSGRRVSSQSAASASPRPRQIQVRTISPAATPYREGDEVEDESYIPEEVSPEPPTPAIRKKPRTVKIVPSIETDNPAPARHRSSSSEPRSSFPITTHRLVNTSALPTITEENEVASDDDLNPLHDTRTAPNAVDVLSQICRETVAAAITNIRTTATGSELKRKIDALESFGRELESRLFDMSAAVENRLTLEGRVRSSKREKSAMQSRWMEVRRQREEVVLRMDAVRKEHWEGEERGAESWKVSEGCFGVGVVMERERGSEIEGLEGLIGSISRGVSGFEGGGVLQRVKDFNARMERMVQVLGVGAQ